MEASHPVIPLVAFVDSDYDETVVDALRRRAEELVAERDERLLGAPELIDETDEAGIRTVGLAHAILAAYDGAGRLLAEDVDRRQLDEVRAIVDALQAVSAEHAIDIGVELDGEGIGWIERGALTDRLRVGLLDSWAARFA